ncbi:MAG: hypothetical protein SVY10_18995 [Thermodesulfobacteriota bacterium]|nr:hypothetical protein [Thermodesulfobacteriota bacterium]
MPGGREKGAVVRVQGAGGRGQTDRLADGQTSRQQTDRLTDGQTSRQQTDRLADSLNV